MFSYVIIPTEFLELDSPVKFSIILHIYVYDIWIFHRMVVSLIHRSQPAVGIVGHCEAFWLMGLSP